MTDPSSSNGNISVNQNLSLQKAQVQNGFPVTFSDWNFLKEKIKRIKLPRKEIFVISNVSFGVCSSSFVAILSFPESTFQTTNYLKTILWSVFIVSGVIGAVCFFLDKRLKEMEVSQERNAIVEHMERIERPYKPDNGSKKGSKIRTQKKSFLRESNHSG